MNPVYEGGSLHHHRVVEEICSAVSGGAQFACRCGKENCEMLAAEPATTRHSQTSIAVVLEINFNILNILLD